MDLAYPAEFTDKQADAREFKQLCDQAVQVVMQCR